MTAEWLSAIFTLATALAALGAVGVAAFNGLGRWRRQHRAAIKQEAATKLLHAIEELSECVSDVRLRFSAGDMMRATFHALGDSMEARVFINSRLTRGGTAIHEATIKALKEFSSASLILGFDVDPARKLPTMAIEIWKALSDVGSRLIAEHEKPIDSTWAAGIPPDELALLSFSPQGDEFFARWLASRAELRKILRPFLLQE